MRHYCLAWFAVIAFASTAHAITPTPTATHTPTPTQTPAATPAQLVLNPGFELPPESNGQPPHWIRKGGDTVISSIGFTDVDPPLETYPEGNQVARAMVTNQLPKDEPAGWYQPVHVVPGEQYELAGYLYTANQFFPLWGHTPLGRIGVDLDGVSTNTATVDVWAATPGQVDDIPGWTESNLKWTHLRTAFTATADWVTIYIDGRTFGEPDWMGVYFDLVTLTGPAPETSTGTATPYPAPTFTPTPVIQDLGGFGRDWTEVMEGANDHWSPRIKPSTVVFDKKMWLAGGQTLGSPDPEANDIWSSGNGTDWTLRVAEAPWSGRSDFRQVAFQDHIWLMGGIGAGNTLFNDVWRSPDGLTWEEVTPAAAWSPRYGHEVVVHDGSLWLLGGNDGEKRHDVWRSSDGKNWELVRATAPWFARESFFAAAKDGRLWVIGGEYATDVWSSADGAIWRLETLDYWRQGRREISGVVYGGHFWLLGGYRRFNTDHRVYQSRDGVNWQRVDYLDWEQRPGSTALAYKDRLWLFAGGFSAKNEVWASGLGVLPPPSRVSLKVR